MKRIYLLTLLACLHGVVLAQSFQGRKCATQVLHQKKMQDNPSYKRNYEEIQRKTNAFQTRQQSLRSARSTTVREIPVYVHIIYDENRPSQNLSDAQIESQIAVLNEDFRAFNDDISQVPDEFKGVVADYQLIFKLEGVFRKASNEKEWTADDLMKSAETGGLDAVTPSTHLNIWVCPLSGGLLGYAQFPGGPLATDGVVVGTSVFGSLDYDENNDFILSERFGKGRTTVHEIGHYLNLRHIWGDGDCSVDDGVRDTPIAAVPNNGCPAFPTKSCNENTAYSSDMFMNYMDYVDDACMFMFSEGQKARSYTLFEPGGFRENLGRVLENCDLPPPSGLRLRSRGTDYLNLTWNSIADAESYEVMVGTTAYTSQSNCITISNLESGFSYDVKVLAKCSSGSLSLYSEQLSLRTVETSYTRPIQFTIQTDLYPEETNWELRVDGLLMQSKTINYNRSSSYIENFDFGDGIYTFEIFDDERDGICCGSGNGSYSLIDAEGTVIKSGGQFGESEEHWFQGKNTAPFDCSSVATATVGDNVKGQSASVFEFEAPKTEMYTISSVATTLVDTDLNIYSDCETLFAQSDNFDYLQSEVSVALTEGQIIYIEWKDTHSAEGFDWQIYEGPGSSCPSLVITDLAVTSVSCEESSDGQIEVVLAGGAPPYRYALDSDNFTNSNTFTNLASGEYALTIVDSRNQILTSKITVKDPVALDIEATIGNNTSAVGNGYISIEVKGGSGNYTYSWSNGASSDLLIGLTAGVYSVVVTDQSGCQVQEIFEVGGIASSGSAIESSFTVYPNPTGAILNLEHAGQSDRVSIYDTRGTTVLEEKIDSRTVPLNVSGLSPGIYFIRLNKESGTKKIMKE